MGNSTKAEKGSDTSERAMKDPQRRGQFVVSLQSLFEPPGTPGAGLPAELLPTRTLGPSEQLRLFLPRLVPFVVSLLGRGSITVFFMLSSFFV